MYSFGLIFLSIVRDSYFFHVTVVIYSIDIIDIVSIVWIYLYVFSHSSVGRCMGYILVCAIINEDDVEVYFL